MNAHVHAHFVCQLKKMIAQLCSPFPVALFDLYANPIPKTTSNQNKILRFPIEQCENSSC